MASRNRAEVRSAVHRRIRRKVRGTTERPRLAVYRSLNHIYAQLIDDEKAQTLASASTIEKTLGVKTGGNIEAAKKIGQTIAERALAAGISSVVFDRGGYLYHGFRSQISNLRSQINYFPVFPGFSFNCTSA